MSEENSGSRREFLRIVGAEETDIAALSKALIHFRMTVKVILKTGSHVLSLRNELHVCRRVGAYLFQQ